MADPIAEPREGLRRRALRHWLAGAALTACLLAFAAIAAAVHDGGALVQFDQVLSHALRATMPHDVLVVLSWVTRLGNAMTLVVLGAIVVAALAWRRQWLLAVAWPATVIGGGYLNTTLKHIFQRARPDYDHRLIVETSYSFPSGHASGSMVAYGMLAYVLIRMTPARYHRRILVAAALTILVVGTSRVLLQVHFFSDVCGGFASGLAWLTLCVGLTEFIRNRLPPAGADAKARLP
jgi:membrane-associated phospholipid phosphatase